jgi:mannose-6-phosphate isomerase-like protein (cupin superfamily)
MTRPHPLVVPFDDLEHTAKRHELIGAEHDVPVAVILILDVPGSGPAPHTHPYPEVFIVEAGEATFRLGDEHVVVSEGHVVIGPSNVAHGFTSNGPGELRVVAIHGSPRFITEWLEGSDPAWRSNPVARPGR